MWLELMRLRAIGVVFVVAAAALAFWASGPAAPSTRAATACPPSLDPGSNSFLPLGGPISPLHLRARGRVRAAMIFVDFRDGRARESTQKAAARLIPGTTRWFAEASYSRLALSITAVHRWYRMPRASTRYSYARGLTFATHRRYISDAVRLADRAVDFRKYQIVYIVAARSPGVTFSPAFHAFRGAGVPADGGEVRWAVTLGNDVHQPEWGYRVPVHETGHLFGLPDLYDFGSPEYPNQLRFVGGWDVMSWVQTGGHFFAWNKWRLGWLAASQLRCLDATGQLVATLSPIERRGGVKAVVVKTGASAATVVEARRRVGEDSSLCDEGVLVYAVSATARTGRGPIRLLSARGGSDEEQIARCGVRYDAGLDAGAAYEDAAVKVEVLASNPDGSYQVRVTRK